MASNVELQRKPRKKIIESDGIDIHTQRPRTPNIPYSAITEEQIANIKKNPECLFLNCKHKYDDRRHWMPRYTYWIKKENLCGYNGVLDKCYIGDELTYNYGPYNDYSRPGAHFHWRLPSKTGSMRGKDLQCAERLVHLPQIQRPMTTLPGFNKMKYGRPGHGYYVQKHPGLNS